MTKAINIYKLIRYILFIVGTGIVTGGVYGLSYIKKIDKEYISTVAKIENIKKYTKRSSKRISAHYDVTVSYVVAEKQYHEQLNFYSATMKVGNNIELKYNPENPSDIRSVEIEHLIFIVMIFVGITILISYLFTPYLFSKLKNGN